MKRKIARLFLFIARKLTAWAFRLDAGLIPKAVFLNALGRSERYIGRSEAESKLRASQRLRTSRFTFHRR